MHAGSEVSVAPFHTNPHIYGSAKESAFSICAMAVQTKPHSSGSHDLK